MRKNVPILKLSATIDSCRIKVLDESGNCPSRDNAVTKFVTPERRSVLNFSVDTAYWDIIYSLHYLYLKYCLQLCCCYLNVSAIMPSSGAYRPG